MEIGSWIFVVVSPICASLHKCDHCAVTNAPFVNMLPICCFVGTYRSLMFGSACNRSNNQSKSIRCTRKTWRMFGDRPLIIILITASLSSKMMSLARCVE